MPLIGCLGVFGLVGLFGVLLFLLDFFLGARTGALIGVAQREPAFWIVIAAALGYVFYRWRRHRDTFGLAEFVAQLGITYLSVLISATYLLAGSYDLADYWVDTEPLYGASYAEAHTARSAEGEPGRVPAVYEVRAGDDGFHKFAISGAQYANLKAFCGNESKVADRHEGQISEGDGRVFAVDCLPRGHPAAILWQTPNYLQASRLTILGSQGRLPEIRELADRIGLSATEYPHWPDAPLGPFEFQRFWALGVAVEPDEGKRAEAVLDALALSSKRAGGGFNPMVVAVSTDADPDAVADALTWRWRAPKRTDAILVINVADDRRIRWARVLAATDDVGVRAVVETAVVALGSFDAAAVARRFAGQVVDGRGRLAFALKHPEEYAYLTAGFGLGWSDFAIMAAIVLAANGLTTRFFTWFNPTLWWRRLRTGVPGRRRRAGAKR